MGCEGAEKRTRSTGYTKKKGKQILKKKKKKERASEGLGGTHTQARSHAHRTGGSPEQTQEKIRGHNANRQKREENTHT